MTTNNVNVIETTDAIATVNTDTEGTVMFNAKWDIFIVPNKAVSMINEYMSLKYASDQIYNMLVFGSLNRLDDIGVSEKLIQVWYTNDQCENGVRHDPFVTDQDNHDWDIKFAMGEYLPESLLKKFHEGETLTVDIPVTLKHRDPVTKEKIARPGIMRCELTARQKKYRYASQGTFEDTLKKVLQ